MDLKKTKNTLFKVPPVMAFSDTWYRAALIYRSEISEIEIVNSYNPTGEEKTSWSADDKYSGSIMCYVIDNGEERLKLIIAGNGSGKIKANKDSTYMFSNSSHFQFFSGVRTITGLELLDTSGATDMRGMFLGFSQAASIDVSHFNTSHVTNMERMFRNCYNLKELDVSGWNVSKVKSMVFMFESCFNLEELDLTGWNVKSVEEHRYMFDKCKIQPDIHFTSSEENKVPKKRPWYKRLLNI